MRPSTYLVFGDLHGRVLPAFKLAHAWSREHGIDLAGLLQVGDLGYFPDPSRFDKATKRHAEKDSLEGGVWLVAQPRPGRVTGPQPVWSGQWPGHKL
jgi:hypothetical protein